MTRLACLPLNQGSDTSHYRNAKHARIARQLELQPFDLEHPPHQSLGTEMVVVVVLLLFDIRCCPPISVNYGGCNCLAGCEWPPYSPPKYFPCPPYPEQRRDGDTFQQFGHRNMYVADAPPPLLLFFLYHLHPSAGDSIGVSACDEGVRLFLIPLPSPITGQKSPFPSNSGWRSA